MPIHLSPLLDVIFVSFDLDIATRDLPALVRAFEYLRLSSTVVWSVSVRPYDTLNPQFTRDHLGQVTDILEKTESLRLFWVWPVRHVSESIECLRETR